ncbi:MAG: T9SS type A sorting domain-containing protein [Crocinitomicaceae bacterium]|nr:T9SS type A sorting domain-containing protein [Crocinitomicaceae bacterium]MDP4869051.1 T9SS type A sorting domain-containing protein [Crocinitomicaceae bacterium]MDP5042591.1 T9SS type A sorting domain-containing protein [Crocinitomicaceae bacterium]MDP5067025.1 T9SS type A sorting domain-containing protein [Crocinitomicaceae bacterium]
MKYLLFACFFVSSLASFAQDTTWVQTFTFDSITTRRADFQFPASLDTERFEKVQMYYKLKCSPLTTWDQYNCGEWDYLTYTRVFDHTGQLDSTDINGMQFMMNWATPAQINFKPLPYQEADQYQIQEFVRNGSALTHYPVNSPGAFSTLPFLTNQQGSKYQFLVHAAELLTAGIQPGALSSLRLNTPSGGLLWHPVIRIASTQENTISQFLNPVFTEVYRASHAPGMSMPPLIPGWNNFVFYQDFIWDGVSNLLIEFTISNDFPVPAIDFIMDANTAPMAASYVGRNGQLELSGSNHTLSSFADEEIGDQFTIEFWAKGNGNTAQNTTFMEALDTAGRRIFNIHMPWSNNNIYFDAGDETGYDRINQAATAPEIDSEWNHWAFVKDQPTGQMYIYKNGQLWLSGNNKNREMGYFHRLVIGASGGNQSLSWKGSLDELRIYKAALSPATIAAYYAQKIDATHPNWPSLVLYHDFDNVKYARDLGPNDHVLMPSELGMIKANDTKFVGQNIQNQRPLLQIGQGNVPPNANINVLTQLQLKEPVVIFEQTPMHRHFELVQTYIGALEGNTNVYDLNGLLINSTPIQTTQTLQNQAITVYNPPYEIIHDVEIARYITPYGIQFDLGPNGFTWIYDVTDYQQYLHGLVDLAAHNTQELIDLKFAFIKGIPPRDVVKREPIWADFRSYNFGQMAADAVLQAKPVVLSDTAEMFKIKTRMSGHGQVGDYACCEWVNNSHQIKVDGVPRFNWSIWDAMVCGDNPNISQGGTWPYAREGWCPGDLVKEFEFELTPYVTPGDTVSLDYAINAVPTTDPGQAGGNYIAAYDLISYSAPNFQNDAAIIDVLNPNNYEYYSKWNPSCQNPRIVLKNTGAQALTSCRIFCWLDYGSNLVFDWTGNLGFLEQTTVEIPVTDMNWWYEQDSSYTFTAWVADVNGQIGPDDYNQNSLMTVKYDAPERIDGPFFIWLTTNNKASENSYQLLDHAGTVLFERSNLQNTTQYKDTFDLAPGCYSIIIEDTDHDGLAFWYSAQVEGETSGQMRLRQVGGSYIEFFPGDFGHYHRYDFTVGFTLDAPQITLDPRVAVYPNPGAGMVTIEMEGDIQGAAQLRVRDLMGRELHREKMNATANFAESFIDFSGYPAGTYLIEIQTASGTYAQKFIRQ